MRRPVGQQSRRGQTRHCWRPRRVLRRNGGLGWHETAASLAGSMPRACVERAERETPGPATPFSLCWLGLRTPSCEIHNLRGLAIQPPALALTACASYVCFLHLAGSLLGATAADYHRHPECSAAVSATLPRSSQSVPHRRRSLYQVSTPIWLGQICRIGRWEHAASARSPSRSGVGCLHLPTGPFPLSGQLA